MIIGIIIAVLITGMMYRREVTVEKKQARTLEDTDMQLIKSAVDDYIYLTDSLAMLIVETNGNIKDFNRLAEDIYDNKPAIQSVQLAPKGVVEYIYPEVGNEAGKINLFEEPDRKEEAEYARDSGKTTVSGPMILRQGGNGIVVRRPVYLMNGKTQRSFWGFSIIVINVSQILEEVNISHFQELGYHYCLSYLDSDGKKQVLSKGGDVGRGADQYTKKIYNKEWTVEVEPERGWVSKGKLTVMFLFLLMVALLFALYRGFVMNFQIMNQSLQNKNDKLSEAANKDALTEIYNRRGGDEAVRKLLLNESVQNGVLITLDIDKFKHLNDIYGHAAGDVALKQLAWDMQKHFGEDAVCIRNGGDEFIIFIPKTDCEKIEQPIRTFATKRHSFWHEEQRVEYTISCGYAEYPKHGAVLGDLCKCADIALYNVKMNGRRGYMKYDVDMSDGERTQLGFDLGEVIEKMPSAMLIYQADRKNEKILYANKWLIQMFGCENLNEFLRYTGGTFKGIVHQEDFERVQEEIWKQITASAAQEKIDYVQYRICSKDGKVYEVEDYGKLVESQKYGKIFYVTLTKKYND